MKNFLLVLCLVFSSQLLFGQQFSQINTGTLFDSFENPAQNSFIPDTSRRYAFNLFIPNFNANALITGNSQVALKERAFIYQYKTDQLTIGQGKFNRIGTNVNAYSILFKFLNNLNGNTEMGLSLQSKVEVHGLVTDESLALFNGYLNFPADHYDNIFNNKINAQAYHQLSFIYREKVSKMLSIGVKLSALMGIENQDLDIQESHVTFLRDDQSANLSLRGRYRINDIPGGITKHDLLPTFRNPGAAISIGTIFNLDNGYKIQTNIKDLGFIRWNSSSKVYDFNSGENIQKILSNKREDNIFGSTYRIIHNGGQTTSFISATDGKVEVSANKSFTLGESGFVYSPTVIASKSLFYNLSTAAMVNPIQYNKYQLSLTAAYNSYKLFTVGTQLMIKATDVEFYVGSDRILQTLSLAAADHTSDAYIAKNPAFTGADVYLGFALKFGPVLEHPLNASNVPMNEKKSFFRRLFNRIKGNED